MQILRYILIIMIDIYIYAFSRRFYPKRLTVHSGYTFVFVSMSSCRPLYPLSTSTFCDRLGYVRNPRSLMEGTEMLCRDDIGDLLGSPDHL